MIKENQKAPDFELKDAEGKKHKLSDYKGKVVLYFYPKDDTPGCTKQACDLRDNLSKLKKVTVLGVSTDDEKSHEKLTKKKKKKLKKKKKKKKKFYKKIKQKKTNGEGKEISLVIFLKQAPLPK